VESEEEEFDDKKGAEVYAEEDIVTLE